MNKWLPLIFIWLPLTSYAGLGSDLQDFFNQGGTPANITSAESYHGQQAGSYTGGSVSARNRVRQTQIVSITLLDDLKNHIKTIDNNQVQNRLKEHIEQTYQSGNMQ